MIVAALKIQQARGGVLKSDDPSNLLQHFLQFWCEHNTYTHGIRVDPPELFEKKLTRMSSDVSTVVEDAQRDEELGATPPVEVMSLSSPVFVNTN